MHTVQPEARVRPRASRWPARLDWMQSVGNLVLALLNLGYPKRYAAGVIANAVPFSFLMSHGKIPLAMSS